MTLRQLMDDYLQQMKMARGLSVNTLAAYRRDLNDLLNWSSLDTPDKITASMIQSYFGFLTERGCRPATVARRISSLKRFFEYLLVGETVKNQPLFYAASNPHK